MGIWIDQTGFYGLKSDAYQVKIDATDGVLYAGGSAVIIDKDGISIDVNSPTREAKTSLEWYYNSVSMGYIHTGSAGLMDITATRISLHAVGSSSIGLEDNDLIILGADNVRASGNIRATGDFISYKNSTEYTGYLYVPLATPLTSTDFDGDSFSTTSKTKIDLSDKFSVPAGVKAVDVYIEIKGSASLTSIYNFGVSPNNTAGSYAVVHKIYGLPNDTYFITNGICPCDSNGDVYYQTYVPSGTMNVKMNIKGYWI